MIRNTAWHLAQIPPRIVYDPKRTTADRPPIEQSERYAIAIRLLEVKEYQIRDELHYCTGYWKGKELKAKARCPLCHMGVHSKIRVHSPDARNSKDRDQIEEEPTEDTGIWNPYWDDILPIRPPPEVLEKRSWKIFHRPFSGVYKDKAFRDCSIPDDSTWDTREYCPGGPGVWPEPGVLDITKSRGDGADLNEDPTCNPWGIWKQMGPYGEMQWYDFNTANTDKHTRLALLIHDDENIPDSAWYVEELDNEQWAEVVAGRKRACCRREMLHCQSHPGKLTNERYTCCQGYSFSPGCVQRKKHMPDTMDTCALRNHWKMHETPWSVRFSRDAVVMDCEMGINYRGEQELIRVSMLDYYSGEILIDSLVYPTVDMLHLNTRWSGVTWPMLKHAKRTGQCVFGRTEALERIFDFVGPTTTLILHGGRGDMSALRWVHRRIIDIQYLEKRRCGGVGSPCSLKELAKRHLGRTIQNGFGHDSVEDAIATRDLCHFYAQKFDSEGYALVDCYPIGRRCFPEPDQFKREFIREWYELCHIEI